jgi:hypothetical protein
LHARGNPKKLFGILGIKNGKWIEKQLIEGYQHLSAFWLLSTVFLNRMHLDPSI